MAYRSRPERKGYRLTEEGENLYAEWLDLGGCICFTGCAPCHVCVNEGHPISLEETDEVWEPDTKFKKGDEIECTSMGLGRIVKGEKFLVVDSRPQLSAPSFHPELVYIEVEGVVRNYSPKHFELVKEGGDNEMSRNDIVNVKEGVVPSGYIWTDHLHTYSQYIKSGWTNEQLIANKLLQPVDNPYSTDKVESVKIDHNGKIEVRLKGHVAPTTVNATISVNKQTEEKQTMSNANNRRIVTVQVFDLDPALDVEHSLVHVFEGVVTEEDNSTTLTELLHTGQLVEPLAAHNKIRTAQDNKDILSRTGKKVKLEAIKVKNLHFKYV